MWKKNERMSGHFLHEPQLYKLLVAQQVHINGILLLISWSMVWLGWVCSIGWSVDLGCLR